MSEKGKYGIVDIDGLNTLRRTKKLIDYSNVRNSTYISNDFFLVRARDFKDVSIYKELTLNMEYTFFTDIKKLLKAFISFETNQNVEIRQTIDPFISNRVSIKFYYGSGLPIYIVENSEEYIYNIINSFSKYHIFLCINNPLLIDQLHAIYGEEFDDRLTSISSEESSHEESSYLNKKKENIIQESTFSYLDIEGLNESTLNLIEDLKKYLPKRTAKGIEKEVEERLSHKDHKLNGFIIIKERLEKIDAHKLIERMKRIRHANPKDIYYDISSEDVYNNIIRIRRGDNPMFLYNREHEYDLITTLVEEREKIGSLDRKSIIEDLKIDQGMITCPSAKEFFNALSKIQKKESLTQHHVYHTLNFSDACAFRVKLTKMGKRSFMLPLSHSEENEETLHSVRSGYLVYYKSDFEVEDISHHEKKKIHASLIDIYGEKGKNKSLDELFQIKVINGEEVRDDASILGFFSDIHTLGLKD